MPLRSYQEGRCKHKTLIQNLSLQLVSIGQRFGLHCFEISVVDRQIKIVVLGRAGFVFGSKGEW